MQRKANAVWKHGLKEGAGTISTDSQVLTDVPYSFGTRFESARGTNPEELVAAAHAACYSMALAAELEKLGSPSNSVKTSATATLEKQHDGWRVTRMHLDVHAEIPDISEGAFQKIANETKSTCPISRLLNANITLNAQLKQKAA